MVSLGTFLASAVADSLEQVAILSRHGIKNQYHARGMKYEYLGVPLADYAPGKRFPSFTVESGELTKHGAAVLREMGIYLREVYKPLFGTHIQATALADPFCKRDSDSADAVLQGFFGLGLKNGSMVDHIHARARQPLSSVFRDEATEWDVTHGCGGGAMRQVGGLFGSSGSGRSSNILTRTYQKEILEVNDWLGCCDDAVCQKLSKKGFGKQQPCTLLDIAEQWNNGSAWRAYRGPLFTAAYFAELFAMQTVNHMNVTGGLDVTQMARALRLQQVNMGLAANFWTARDLGSALLAHMLAVLVHKAAMIEAKVAVSATARNSAKAAAAVAATALKEDAPISELKHSSNTLTQAQILFYFGHDTNLQFIRRLLRVNWISLGWGANLAEPGAMIVMELWRKKDTDGSDWKERFYVRLFKVVASPEQQRDLAQLRPQHLNRSITKLRQEPDWAALSIPGCGRMQGIDSSDDNDDGSHKGEGTGRSRTEAMRGGSLCTLREFSSVVTASLKPSCIQWGPLRHYALSLASAASAAEDATKETSFASPHHTFLTPAPTPDLLDREEEDIIWSVKLSGVVITFVLLLVLILVLSLASGFGVFYAWARCQYAGEAGKAADDAGPLQSAQVLSSVEMREMGVTS